MTLRARYQALRRPLLCAVTASVLSSIPYLSVLVGKSTAMYEDTNDQYLPKIIAVWRAVRSGQTPWWSPFHYAGFNMLGFGQAGIFYPPNALYGALSPIAAHRWWLVFHVWLAASGAALWSWNRWRHHLGAVVSGVAYALCGFMVLHLMHMVLIASAAWLPWALLGTDRLLKRWSLPNALLVAGPTAMCALVGHPQGLWQLLVAVVVSAGIQTVCLPIDSIRATALRFIRPVGATVLGVGLGALQLLPQVLLGRTSTRASLSKADAFTFADAPHHLLTLIAPWLYGANSTLGAREWREPGLPPHEYISYVGITVLALAIIGVIARGRDPRSISLIVLTAFAALSMLADHTPFGAITYHLVPFARSFRAWSRNAILISAAASSLAGAGVQAIEQQPRRWRAHAATLVLLATSVFLVHRLAMLQDGRLVDGPGWVAAAGLPLLLLVALATAVWVLGNKPRVIAAVLAAIVALDMIGFTLTAPWRSSQKSSTYIEWVLGDDPAVLGTTYDAPGGIDRWYSNDLNLRGWALTRSTPGVIGYDPLIQRNLAEVAAGLDYLGNSNRPDFWEPTWIPDLFRVTTMYAIPGTIVTDPTWKGADLVSGGQFIRYTRTPRLPEAYVVSDIRTASFDAILAELRFDPARSIDLRHTAFVEQGGPGANTAASTNSGVGVMGSASGSMDDDGRGRYEVTTDRPALLVVLYSWLPGWSAHVDGKPQSVARVNGAMLGVPVPAGTHTVTLTFRPPGLRPGVVVSLLSLLGLITPSVVLNVRKRLRARLAVGPDR